MIAGLDSSTPPTLAAVKAAAAAGVTLWNGYIQTRPGLGLYRAWARADFEVARQAGSTPIAFCSGWDDPVAVKALALAWNVRLCVDIERGIRPDGAWKQAWLDASGAGIYGNYGCHNCRAAFHVLSAYPGSSDVQATWWSATPRPAGPCGWQWAGTHTEFGIGVDRGDYDDFFGSNSGEDMALPEPERTWLLRLYVEKFGTAATGADPALAAYQAQGEKERAEIAEILADIKANPPAPVATVDVAALAAALAPLMPAQSKPPVAPQAVKDWIISLLKSWGWL